MDKTTKQNKRKVEVPGFFKRKVFIVSMMLLCSGILVVVATYAWFILATAPEVSGITTTIGSNGSLEMALLEEKTYDNMTLIQANVGDSLDTEGKAATEANITWGNLVDLSDPSYGLSSITLYPSILSESSGKVDTSAMLSVAHNGTDGRIKSVSADTATASYKDNEFNTANSAHGVRAVGKASSGSSSGRLGSFNSAKSAFSSNQSTAKSKAVSTINANSAALQRILAGSTSDNFSYNDVKALRDIAQGYYDALNYVFSAYKSAVLAAAASASDSAYNSVKNGISDTADVTLAVYTSYLTEVGTSSADLSDLSAAMNKALTAISSANALLTDDEGEQVPESTTYTPAQVSTIRNALYSGSASKEEIYTNSGVTGDVNSGLLTALAEYIGSYSINAGVTVAIKTETNEGKGWLAKVDLSKLEAPAAETTTTTTATSTVMTTFYGYVIDLAFRTNAAANLQLQSDAVNRIYTDGGSGTAGSGSKAILNYVEGMTETQIKNMLNGVRVVFFDPESGTIYGRAKLGDPTIDSGTKTATATLYLMDDSGTVQTAANATLTALEVATPKKVSALVYLDGTSIDNMGVTNAASSGTLLLNLQFSSSADLKPMEDSEIKNAN
jgi:hypothetical protein